MDYLVRFQQGNLHRVAHYVHEVHGVVGALCSRKPKPAAGDQPRNGRWELVTALPPGVRICLRCQKRKQKEMNPEEAFFLLDDGRAAIPPLFYPMLNKCLAVPVLEEWAGYLWENGRERRLITLLNDGEGQGYAAWRVLPAADEWQSIIQAGLQEKTIDF